MMKGYADMKLSEVQTCILSLFDAEKLERFPDEWAFRAAGDGDVSRVGYATNLTPETVEEAVRNEVGLMITHHDAWDFLYGMKEYCMGKLQEHGISHCFFHLPLDDADFGTSASLAKALGLRIVEKSNLYRDTFYCGRIGEFNAAVEFECLRGSLENLLGEPVRAWKSHDRPIKRVCVAAGGGLMTNDVKDAVDGTCDAYITGEKTLYTVEYARFAGINLFVGSHTFTEIFGVENLAAKVKDRFGDIDVMKLKEDHIE